jgi:hypothetical protein
MSINGVTAFNAVFPCSLQVRTGFGLGFGPRLSFRSRSLLGMSSECMI